MWSTKASPPKFPDSGHWGRVLGAEGPKVLGPRLPALLLWGPEALGRARGGRWAWGTPGGGGAQGAPAPRSLREGRSG